MLTATQMIFDQIADLGSTTPDRCLLCGGVAYQPQPTKAVLKATFTDYDRAQADSDVICIACAWFMQERNEEMAWKVGNPKPISARLYSHFLLDGEWLAYSKGDKLAIHDILTQAIPQVCIISTSGQKHLAFKAKVNSEDSDTGWVQFESQTIWMEQSLYLLLYNHIHVLYNQGKCSKSDIQSGNYTYWLPENIVLFQHEKFIAEHRGKPEFLIAVHLVTKEES